MASRVGARQSSRAALPKCLRQPQHLATAKPNECCCLRNPDPLLSQIAQYIHPIDLRTAIKFTVIGRQLPIRFENRGE